MMAHVPEAARAQELLDVREGEEVHMTALPAPRVVRGVGEAPAEHQSAQVAREADVRGREVEPASRPQDARRLASELGRIAHVLDHLEADDGVEGRVWERQRLEVEVDPQHGDPARRCRLELLGVPVHPVHAPEARRQRRGDGATATADIEQRLPRLDEREGELLAHAGRKLDDLTVG